MTLKRITRVSVTNWRSWQGETTVDLPEAGVTVLYGPNAVGKTGLWEALVAGLLDRHWGTHTERLRPVGTKGVLPRVEVEFETESRRLRIDKTFGGTRDRASLLEEKGGEYALVDQGEEAYLLCRRAVLGADDAVPNRGGPDKALKDTLMEVLLPAQGTLVADSPAPDAVSVAITDREAATSATRVGRILAAVSRDADEVWVGKRDRPKKGSDLARDEERLDEIGRSMAPLEEKTARIRDCVRDLARASEELEGLGEAAGQIALAARLREEAEAHRDLREAAEKGAREAGVRAEGLEAHRAERAGRVKAAAAASDGVGQSGKVLAEASDKRRAAEEEHRRETERRDRLAADVARYRQWIEYESRESELDHLRRAAKGAAHRLETIRTQEKARAEAEAEKAALDLPTKAEWQESDRLHRELSEAEGRLTASAWSVAGEIPERTRLWVDGAEVGPDGLPCDATRVVEVKGEDGTVLRLTAPTEEAGRVESLRAKVAAFLERFGVGDLTELRKRNDHVRNDLLPAIHMADERIRDALANGDRNDLLKEELRLEAAIEKLERLARPATDRPESAPEEWKVRREVLESELETAGNGVETRGAEKATVIEREKKARDGVRAAEVSHTEAQENLGSHRERHGPDEDLAEAAARAKEEAGKLAGGARALVEAKAMAEDEKLRRAKRLTEDLSDAIRAETRIREIQTEIDTLRRENPEGRLADLEAERAELAPRVRAARSKAEALLLLETALNEEKARITTAIGEPVRERLQRWISYLLQDDSLVAVDEKGRPSVIRTPAGREVPFPDQSFGTREQVSILYRLAVADLVAEEAGAGVAIVLDDPFGHTDRGRRGRLLEILGAEAGRRGHQVLIFTCRPEDFDGVGTHVSLASRAASPGPGRIS